MKEPDPAVAAASVLSFLGPRHTASATSHTSAQTSSVVSSNTASVRVPFFVVFATRAYEGHVAA